MLESNRSYNISINEAYLEVLGLTTMNEDRIDNLLDNSSLDNEAKKRVKEVNDKLTNTKSYSQWLIRNAKDVDDSLIPVINYFEKHKSDFIERDIIKYDVKTLKEKVLPKIELSPSKETKFKSLEPESRETDEYATWYSKKDGRPLYNRRVGQGYHMKDRIKTLEDMYDIVELGDIRTIYTIDDVPLAHKFTREKRFEQITKSKNIEPEDLNKREFAMMEIVKSLSDDMVGIIRNAYPYSYFDNNGKFKRGTHYKVANVNDIKNDIRSYYMEELIPYKGTNKTKYKINDLVTYNEKTCKIKNIVDNTILIYVPVHGERWVSESMIDEAVKVVIRKPKILKGGDNIPLTFGIHQGQTPKEIAIRSPAYIVRMYETASSGHNLCSKELYEKCKRIMEARKQER